MLLNARLETYNRLVSTFESMNGYAYESEIAGVLKGLGFQEADFSKQTDRPCPEDKNLQCCVRKTASSQPGHSLLDEPTNHLDLNSISWLETYLLNYTGAVFIISHDRYFLNRVVTKVVEIERGTIRTYVGNYKRLTQRRNSRSGMHN